MAPVERLDPLTWTVAVEPFNAAVPILVPPRVNTTDPVGIVLLPGTVTVAVKVVLAFAAIVVELAVTAVLVATDTRLTVMVAVPFEPLKALVAPNVAVMVLLPRARLPALTLMLAVEPESVATPNVVLPRLKVTLPAGVALPLAAFTVAVTVVVWIERMEDGLAASVVVVATGGGVTVTTTVPLEFTKPVPAV